MFFLFLITFSIFHTMFLMNTHLSKKLKNVTKKIFGGKSREGMVDTLFQGCSTSTSRRAEIMKHFDQSLVGQMVCFQRDEAILLFLYHFAI
jgi:hypothetical protein